MNGLHIWSQLKHKKSPTNRVIVRFQILRRALAPIPWGHVPDLQIRPGMSADDRAEIWRRRRTLPLALVGPADDVLAESEPVLVEVREDGALILVPPPPIPKTVDVWPVRVGDISSALVVSPDGSSIVTNIETMPLIGRNSGSAVIQSPLRNTLQFDLLVTHPCVTRVEPGHLEYSGEPYGPQWRY